MRGGVRDKQGQRGMVVAVIMVMFANVVFSQDIHFSQTDYILVLTDPGYSGFFDGKGRFGLIYRNQWASVHDPFQTIAATIEVPVHQNKYHRSGFSLGGYLYADKAGTLSYGTLSADLIVSYYKAFNTYNDNLISIALMGGFNRVGFDPTDAIMEDMSEQFDREKVNYPTIGAGVAYYSQLSQEFVLKVGVSAYNLNRPKLSYFSESKTRLEPRFNAYVRGDWRFVQQWSFMPVAAVQFQYNNMEILAGTDFKYIVDESSRRLLSFQFGAAYRWADAVIFDIGVEYNQYLFFFLYDANLSKLTPASNSIGAFEVGIVYRLNRGRQKYQALPCPII